jgi:hypothetical protein
MSMPAQNKQVGDKDPVENASTSDTPQVERAPSSAAPAPANFAPDLGKAIADAMIAANTARVTPAAATPGMNETVPGGMFIVGGRVVDANGNPIKDPPADVQKHADETAGRIAVSQEMEPV